MSHGLLTEEWADGVYSFRLGYGQWLELDQLLQVGPMALYVRLLDRTWKANDLREVIRVGLIGGGGSPAQALRLAKLYVEDRPIAESLGLALRIISAALFLPDGVDKPGEAQATEISTSGSTSPSPTGTLQ